LPVTFYCDRETKKKRNITTGGKGNRGQHRQRIQRTTNAAGKRFLEKTAKEKAGKILREKKKRDLEDHIRKSGFFLDRNGTESGKIRGEKAL